MVETGNNGLANLWAVGGKHEPGKSEIIGKEWAHVCPVCGQKVNGKLSRCPHCGANLSLINCPTCGGEIFASVDVCPRCTAPLGEKRD